MQREIISTRVSKDIKQSLIKKAKKAKRNLSDYLRLRIEKQESEDDKNLFI